MTAFCGCSFNAGAAFTVEQQRKHKEHTLAAMFTWELLQIPNEEVREALMMARLAYQEALDRLVPDEPKKANPKQERER